MSVILLLAPALLAAWYHFKLKALPLHWLEFFIISSIYALFINLFIFSLAWLRGHDVASPSSLFSTLLNCLKYGGLATVAALAFPNIVVLAERVLGRHER